MPRGGCRFAAGLAVLLALRPRRPGRPPRQASLVQTQIILAVVGSVVMIVLALKPKLDGLLGRHSLQHGLRSSSGEALTYEVELPINRRVDRISTAILKIDPENVTGMDWEDSDKKK
jgi:hypothetical protein